jgi:16S rRNA (adenine1518-N6/adenine1519-N6)-dimethyltransferase
MNPRAKKRYGQHFIHDKDVINRILDNIETDIKYTLIEIGPGRGALTFPLLSHIDTLHVVEIDKDLAELLESTEQSGGKLIIHREDALKLDFCNRFDGTLNIIGNLPYNISTPLLFHLLDHSKCINEMLFMMQKEVAVRICSRPGNKEYGRLSVMVQSVCEVQQLFDVSPGSFTPQPKVDSTVIKLVPGSHLHGVLYSPDNLKIIVRAAFSKRRKTLRNALKGLIDEQGMTSTGIDPSSRPEEISVDSYIRLANNLK